MATNKWQGDYEYKGFTIWCPSEDGTWITEPDWSIEAIENFKGSAERLDHPTIAKAKKWVREVGVHLKEEDYA